MKIWQRPSIGLMVTLVVIAALIFFMLLPSFGAARRSSRRMAAQSTHRQLAQTMRLDALEAGTPEREHAMLLASTIQATTPLTAADTRKLVRQYQFTLEVDDPREFARRLNSFATEYQGYIVTANTEEYFENHYTAQVTLRIDADRIDEAVNRLRGMVNKVINETAVTRDVTERYVDLEARLENLKRTEIALRQVLDGIHDRQGSMQDVVAVYRELTSMRGEIDSMQAQLNTLHRSVALAEIGITLQPPAGPVKIVENQWSAVQTSRQAARSLVFALQWIASGLIFTIITVLPILALFCGTIWVLLRIARRGRRPAAV